MGKAKYDEPLSDKWISAKIRQKTPFERADGLVGGLTLTFRDGYTTPVWRLRFRIAGKPRVMILGSYGDLSLANARKDARERRARVTLGHDVADEKAQRKREAAAKIDAAKNVMTVTKLAEEYFERHVLTRWKHPNIVRARIEKDINPNIGHMPITDVRPRDVDAMVQSVIKRGAPTMANDVLRWTRKIFDYAMRRELVPSNPAALFNLSDAGGTEEARERALSREELVKFFEAMRVTKGFSVENLHTFKLLLLLAVRKSELTNAPLSEFDLKAAVWALPAERSKTGAAIDIPLTKPASAALRELMRLGEGSDYLLPARKAQSRMLPHIHENTLNVALSKVQRQMKGVAPFTVHDLRRTARTHMAALGVAPHIAEKCLNHKTKGVAGTYDRHDYFDERREAMAKWSSFVEACEREAAKAKGGKS